MVICSVFLKVNCVFSYQRIVVYHVPNLVWNVEESYPLLVGSLEGGNWLVSSVRSREQTSKAGLVGDSSPVNSLRSPGDGDVIERFARVVDVRVHCVLVDERCSAARGRHLFYTRESMDEESLP